MEPYHVMFVCTGNICRSPMAEGILRHMIDSTRKSQNAVPIEVSSAGTVAVDGHPASKTAVQVAAEHGVFIEEHLSRALTEENVGRADLILTMTPEHREYIENNFTGHSKVFELKRFGQVPGKLVDPYVPDPIGLSKLFYVNIFKDIYNEITRVFPIIMEKAKRKQENG